MNDDSNLLKPIMRDIVAISSLSSVWVDQAPSQVADSLVETLRRTFNLEFAYILFTDTDLRIESAYATSGFLKAQELARLGDTLAPLIKTDARDIRVTNPLGGGDVNLSLIPVGHNFEHGFLVAASKRGDFNQESERILINIAANQAFVTMQYKLEIQKSERLTYGRLLIEDRLNLALTSSNIGFWEWDAKTGRVDISNTLMADWGIDPESFNHTLPECLARIHEEDRDRVAAEIEAAAYHQKPYSIEYRVNRPNGETIWVNAKGRFTRDADDEPDRLTGITINVTDRKRVSIELQKAKDEAENANALKSAFLANMSHEVRTPLGVMMGFTDLIADPSSSAEDRAQYAKVLKRNGEQLAVIVNDILDLSKVEAGFLQVEDLEFNLNTLLNEVVESQKARADEKAIVLKLEIAPKVPTQIGCDPVRLRQILSNMLNNAIKFTDRGGITLLVSPSGNQICFRVTDTGIGISADHIAKLFKPFSQADISTSRKFGGTGLGLTLSKRLAGMLGGDLVLEKTEIGVGSTFTLTIDNHLERARGLSSKTKTAAQPAKSADGLKHLKILLVDDSADNQELIGTVLKKQGALVECADNGLEAIEKALRGKFDVVIMDVQMPIMDGYTATQRLREQGYRRPILALTAHAMSEIRERCLDVGYTDYLTKPINFGELVRKIEIYLD